MKTCAYCGRENEDAALVCGECGREFESAKAPEAGLVDPALALVTVAKFGDLIHATLLRDELELAGIPACIPEDLAASPFGEFIPLAQVTVQVAARDYEAAKEIVAAQAAL